MRIPICIYVVVEMYTYMNEKPNITYKQIYLNIFYLIKHNF